METVETFVMISLLFSRVDTVKAYFILSRASQYLVNGKLQQAGWSTKEFNSDEVQGGQTDVR